ncbi:MAG: D-TA family PLP-dependent enzyme [Limisphaerales bacterium]
MSRTSTGSNWFEVENLDEIESPALLIYPERVEENIRRMISMAAHPENLRPHVKTHKLAPLVALQMSAGISKFKAATLAEAEMLGRASAADILLAYQPVGPAARRFIDLIEAFPNSTFACLVDDAAAAQRLSERAAERGRKVNVLLDIDCGQHRTGVPPDEKAAEFYQWLCRLAGLSPIGLQAYDGHLHSSHFEQRQKECEAAFEPVARLRQRLQSLGLPTATMVAGGTPTFPFHARRPDVECSPGTCVLWDFGYSSRLPDLDFLHAALVLTRVVSKPEKRRLCLDLGHKAIASENPPPRVHFLNAPPSRPVMHSEEHLVIEPEVFQEWTVGDCLFGVPWHICPTVALYNEAVVIKQGRAMERWPIARDRRLRI